MRIYTYTRTHAYIDDPTLFSLSVSTHFYLFSFWAFWDTYTRTHTYILRQEHNVASTRAAGCARVGQQYTRTCLTRPSSDRDDDPSQCLCTVRGTYPISSWLRRWVRRGFHRRLCVHWWTMWPLDWTSSIKSHDEACWNAYASSCRLSKKSYQVWSESLWDHVAACAAPRQQLAVRHAEHSGGEAYIQHCCVTLLCVLPVIVPK
jgi:hypothetical protein